MITSCLPLPALYCAEDDLVSSLATLDTLSSEDESLGPEIELDIAARIASEPGRVDQVARILAHLEAQAALASQEIARLQARREYFLRAMERLEGCAGTALKTSGQGTLRGRTAGFYLVPDYSVFIEDFRLLAGEFKIVTIAVNKDAVKEALLSGHSVPGARLVESNRLERL